MGLAEAPYNVYPTADGHIAIICVNDGHWRALATAMGRADLAEDPRFSSLKQRVANMDLVDRIVGEWTSRYEKAAVFALLIGLHVPCAPVNTLDEVLNDPNMHARGAIVWQDHPQLGRIIVQQSPLRYDGVMPLSLKPSRPLGADTESVLGRLLPKRP